MRKRTLFFIVLTSIVAFLVCCVTPETAEGPVEPRPAVEAEPAVSQAPPAETEDKLAENAEPSDENAEFTVSEEVYERTFQDIEGLIKELNTIIRNMEYETWLSYLSESYIELYSDPQRLSDLSEQPLLRKYNIVLSNLKDYFQYVVVPSRSNARLDEIIFEDEQHVKAIMFIQEQRTILYQLVYIDNRWKIGI